jgi:hypothetical protein
MRSNYSHPPQVFLRTHAARPVSLPHTSFRKHTQHLPDAPLVLSRNHSPPASSHALAGVFSVRVFFLSHKFPNRFTSRWVLVTSRVSKGGGTGTKHYLTPQPQPHPQSHPQTHISKPMRIRGPLFSHPVPRIRSPRRDLPFGTFLRPTSLTSRLPTPFQDVSEHHSPAPPLVVWRHDAPLPLCTPLRLWKFDRSFISRVIFRSAILT